MTSSKGPALAACLLAGIAATGCTTTERTVGGALIGGAGGAVVGDAIGGSGGAVAGALIGGTGGAIIGRNSR